MKRFAFSACTLALALAAAPAAGQNIYVLLGPSFPISDHGEYANVGIHAAGGVAFAVAENLELYGEAFWGQNSHDGEDSKTNPYGFMAGGLFQFSDGAAVDPYVFGGAGLMWHKYTVDSESFSEDSSESALGSSSAVAGGSISEASTLSRKLGASALRSKPRARGSRMRARRWWQ